MDNIILPEPGITEDTEKNFFSWLRESPNNFSFWFPKIKDCGIPVPESVIIQLDDETVRSLFGERKGDKERLLSFVNDKVMPIIPAGWKRIFVKNGCFSNKFDFTLCTPDKTVESIVNSLHYINEASFCFDTCGNAEFVIREYIEDDGPLSLHKIYNGMPLRPEIRVFYDFDNRKVLYSANYWDWGYCHEAISRDTEDKKQYEAAYPTIESIYNVCHEHAEELVKAKLKNVKGLEGIWSIDLMYAQNRWWLIDMAVSHMSAYWDPKRIITTE